MFAIATFGMGIKAVSCRVGRHAYYLTLLQLVEAAMWVYISQPILILSTMFSKISICLFLLRLFVRSTPWKRALWSLIAFIVATNVASASVGLLQCEPVEKLWDSFLDGTYRAIENQIAIGYFQVGEKSLMSLLKISFRC